MLEEYLIMLYMQYCSANNIPLNNIEEYQKTMNKRIIETIINNTSNKNKRSQSRSLYS